VLYLLFKFSDEFIALATEVGLGAIRKERFRLHCARNYRRDDEEVKDTTANLVRTLCCLIKLYGQHMQMKLVKLSNLTFYLLSHCNCQSYIYLVQSPAASLLH